MRVGPCRSQAQNRAIALEMLKVKLLVMLEEQQALTVAEIRGAIVKAEWGQQAGPRRLSCACPAPIASLP